MAELSTVARPYAQAVFETAQEQGAQSQSHRKPWIGAAVNAHRSMGTAARRGLPALPFGSW